MSPIETENQAHDDRVQSDKLKLLFHQSYQAVFFTIAIALIFAGILWPQNNHDPIIAWLLLISVTSTLRLILFSTYKYQKPDHRAILKWERPYYATMIISSVAWGFGTTFITYNLPYLYQVINFLTLMGMAGAAISVYSALRYFTLTTIFLLLLPITLVFALHGDRTSLLIALSSGLFLMSALRSSKILTTTLNKTYLLSSELRLAKEKAEILARTDTLTQLHNRRAFSELSNTQIQFCRRHNHPVSILLMDLDHFKKVNDTHGHAAGDIVLQNISDIIKSTIRNSDICGRLGGEEFAVTLPETNLKEAIKVAEKLRATIENSNTKINDMTIHVTVSIGVACEDKDLEPMLNIADKAMYQAKQTGRNKVVSYNPDQPVIN